MITPTDREQYAMGMPIFHPDCGLKSGFPTLVLLPSKTPKKQLFFLEESSLLILVGGLQDVLFFRILGIIMQID